MNPRNDPCLLQTQAAAATQASKPFFERFASSIASTLVSRLISNVNVSISNIKFVVVQDALSVGMTISTFLVNNDENDFPEHDDEPSTSASSSPSSAPASSTAPCEDAPPSAGNAANSLVITKRIKLQGVGVFMKHTDTDQAQDFLPDDPRNSSLDNAFASFFPLQTDFDSFVIRHHNVDALISIQSSSSGSDAASNSSTSSANARKSSEPSRSAPTSDNAAQWNLSSHAALKMSVDPISVVMSKSQYYVLNSFLSTALRVQNGRPPISPISDPVEPDHVKYLQHSGGKCE